MKALLPDKGAPTTCAERRRMLRAYMALILLLTIPFAIANDPGHDTLYIEERGNSTLTGNLNISEELRVANLIYSSYIDILGNGSQPAGSYAQLYTSSDGNNLYINAPTAVRLAWDSGSTVYVGNTGVNLVVSGSITSGGTAVCLSNGTNCISGNNSGNVSSVTAGSGLTDSGTASNPVLDINLDSGSGLAVNSDALGMIRTCGDGQLLKWNNTASAWECEDDNSGAGGTVTGTGTSGRVTYWSNTSALTSKSGFTFDGTDLTLPGDINMPSTFSIGSSASASDTNAIAIGPGATTDAGYTVVIGSGAQANDAFNTDYAVVIGPNAYAGDGAYSVVLGYNARSWTNDGIAIGRNSMAYASGGVAIGRDTYTVSYGTALGYSANNTGDRGIAIGYDSSNPFANSIALGRSATSTSTNQLMIGSSSYNLNTYIHGTLETTGIATLPASSTVDGSIICTAANGLCNNTQSVDYQNSAAGWTNDSTTTSTSLDVNITTGNLTVPNGRVGIGTSTLDANLVLSGSTPSLRIEDEVTSLSTNDSIGRVEWYTNDNNNAGPNTSYIEAIALNSGTDFGLAFGVTRNNNLEQKMILTAEGYLGLDTGTPGASPPTNFVADYLSTILKVQAKASNKDAGLFLRDSTNIGLDIWYDGSAEDSFIDSRYDNDYGNIYMRTKTAGTPVNALTILGSGNIGINTTDPNATLHVVGSLETSGAATIGAASTVAGSSICTPANGLCNQTASGNVSGSGSTNTLTKWTGSGTIGDSIVSDDGSTATVSGILSTTGKITVGAAGSTFNTYASFGSMVVHTTRGLYSGGYLNNHVYPQSSGPIEYLSGDTSDGAATAHLFETANTLSTAGDKVAVFKNNGTELFAIDKDGNVNATGTIYDSSGQVCTASNGLCGGASSGGGWSNTSTTTSTSLDVNITTGNLTIANGFVGIGTNNPTRPLQVQSLTSDASMSVVASGGDAFYYFGSVGDDDAGGIIYRPAIDRLGFRTAGVSDRVVIDSNGQVGIGTDTTPDAQLAVNVGSSSTTGLIVQGATSQSANLQEWQNSSGSTLAYVNASGTLFDASGQVCTASNGLCSSGATVNTGTTNKLAYYSSSNTLDNFTGTNNGAIYYNSSGEVESGTLPTVSGGTGLTSSSDDALMVGSGTTWQTKTLPTCSGSGAFLQYNTLTNTFSCGSESGDITDVLAGTGINITDSGGPSPTVSVNNTWLEANYVGQNEYPNLDTDKTNDVTGSGTGGYIPKWTKSSELGDSLIEDDGSTITISTPGEALKLYQPLATGLRKDIYLTLDGGATGDGRYVYFPAGSIDWYTGIPVHDTLGAGTGFGIGQSTLYSDMAFWIDDDNNTFFQKGNVSILSTANPGLAIGDGSTGSLKIGGVTVSVSKGKLTFNAGIIADSFDSTNDYFYADDSGISFDDSTGNGFQVDNTGLSNDIFYPYNDNTMTFKSNSGTLVALFNSTAATRVPLGIRAHASQTANLQEWQNSSGAAMAYVDASGQLNLNADAYGDSGGLFFAGGNTGIYASSANVLVVANGGGTNFEFTGSNLRSWSGTGPNIISQAMTSTAPGYSIRGDLDTGIGWAGADNLSLITGGVEAVRITDAQNVDVTGNITMNGGDSVCTPANGLCNQTDTTLSEAEVEGYVYDNDNTLSGPWSVAASGTNDINFDSNTFVVDASENRVGLGVAAPSKRLEVSDGSKGITLDPDASVPTINTTSGNLTISSAGGYVIINVG